MKKFICLIIALIMSITSFGGIISSALKNEQSHLQKGVLYSNSVPNWFLITTVATAKNLIKDPALLKKCTLEFFENHKIYGLCFSVKGSNSTVTYNGNFGYNVNVPANSDNESQTTYIDFIVVDWSEATSNINITLNYKFNNSDGSYTTQTTRLNPTQILAFAPDKAPVVKKVTKVKAKSPKKKTIKITWKKLKNITGYEIEIATNKKFKSGKTQNYTIKKNKNKIIIKKLKRKKKYYVRVKAYKTLVLNGKKTTVYSPKWSAVKAIKTK